MGVVDEVKARVDIAELIGRHIHLQKSGRYLKGLCPFHTEKTPSFFVFPDDQHWHCFGCGKGGDVYNFVMDFEGLDFRGALEELARRAGVELRPRTPEQVEAETEAERLRLLLAASAEYYHTLLLTAPQAAHARTYLKGRGFTRETVDTFQVGYCLESWDALRTYLLGKDFSVEDQIKAGMLIQRDTGGTYDRFRDRVMIPIHDRRGQVVAFGGRVLSADAQPKYMNSPQTVLFDKSKVLFGYHHASQAIRQADEAIIVEGYMDVMIPHQAGYKNVVAPMGTALTESHLKQLQRLTRRFVLALDPDAAGVHGTLKGLETARATLDREWVPVFDPRGLVGYEGRLKADIRVVTLPDGLDPDELILANPANWEALVADSQPIVRFFFQQLLQQENPDEPKGKACIVDAMLPLLSDISNGVEREAYVQEMALRLGLDARALLDRLRVRDRAQAVRQQAAEGREHKSRRASSPGPRRGAQRERHAGSLGGPPPDMPSVNAVPPLPDEDAPVASVRSNDKQAHALGLLMRFPELLAMVDRQFQAGALDPINDTDFSSAYRMVWLAWLEMGLHPELELEDLLPFDLVEQVYYWIGINIPEISTDQVMRDVARTVLHIRENRLREMLTHIQGLIAEAQFAGDFKGTQYIGAWRELSTTLRQVQLALAE